MRKQPIMDNYSQELNSFYRFHFGDIFCFLPFPVSFSLFLCAFLHFYSINVPFSGSTGKTYFFKGKSFWQFNDSLMQVERMRPELSATRWMGCPRETTTYSNEVYDDDERRQERKEPLISSSNSADLVRMTSLNVIILSISIMCIALF